ncbi:MAG: hypothetical protein EHM28_02605 [Spirochaetaceae bacterium]|nr:MAG: hypothetical protein EHM28_02605 [Spirochaetaceae bacterium]
MNLRKKASAILIPLFLAILSPLAAESFDSYLHLQGKEQAGPPEIFAGQLILTYQADRKLFFVGARFSHEDFAVLHSFAKNANNVYILMLPLPEGTSSIKYRLLVDGVWTHDPNNPAQERDQIGTILSVVNFARANTISAMVDSPRLLPGNMVEFTIQAAPGSLVYIAGDFNAWDPFSLRLEETTTGVFSIKLKLISGRHYYYFLVDSVRMIDPRNVSVMVDNDGMYVSSVTVNSIIR